MRKEKTASFRITAFASLLMLIASIADIIIGRPSMAFYGISTVLCFLILYALIIVLRRELESWKIIISDIFMIVAIYLSNRFDLYHRFWFFDIILHSFSGVIIASVLPTLFLKDETRRAMSPLEAAFISFVFAVASAGFWEIMEFSFDLLTKSDVQRNLIRERELLSSDWQNPGILDTMNDMINGTAGGILGSVLIFINEKIRRRG